MPTPDFTPTTTPPTAVVMPSMAPTATDPTSIANGNGAPTATPPTSIEMSGKTPTNQGVTPVALGATQPTATAPTAVALAGMAPKPVAPSPITLGGMKPLQEAPRVIGYKNTPKPLVDINVNTPSIIIPGALTLNQLYGQVRAPQASVLERVQVNLTEPPVGSAAVIDLVDAAGNPWGAQVTVADGQTFGETVVNPNSLISLQAGSNVFAKPSAVGATQPGGFGAVTLFTRLAIT